MLAVILKEIDFSRDLFWCIPTSECGTDIFFNGFRWVHNLLIYCGIYIRVEGNYIKIWKRWPCAERATVQFFFLLFCLLFLLFYFSILFFFLLDEKYSALHNYDQILIDFYGFNCSMTNAQVNICENGKCRKHFDWFSYAVYFHTEINFDIHGISFYIFITTPAVEVEIIEEKMSAFFGWIEN